ncbi:hypothetical protein [Rhizohabitans arisaemae]|uniref:hypothetical protein n=1 Tax=Rhizohabitans arisaemae TaxID=2720610 RepID=UPI0024B0ECB1|nr:hypothetical protein [Rhizohabitans arisaemae]
MSVGVLITSGGASTASALGAEGFTVPWSEPPAVEISPTPSPLSRPEAGAPVSMALDVVSDGLPPFDKADDGPHNGLVRAGDEMLYRIRVIAGRQVAAGAFLVVEAEPRTSTGTVGCGQQTVRFTDGEARCPIGRADVEEGFDVKLVVPVETSLNDAVTLTASVESPALGPLGTRSVSTVVVGTVSPIGTAMSGPVPPASSATLTAFGQQATGEPSGPAAEPYVQLHQTRPAEGAAPAKQTGLAGPGSSIAADVEEHPRTVPRQRRAPRAGAPGSGGRGHREVGVGRTPRRAPALPRPVPVTAPIQIPSTPGGTGPVPAMARPPVGGAASVPEARVGLPPVPPPPPAPPAGPGTLPTVEGAGEGGVTTLIEPMRLTGVRSLPAVVGAILVLLVLLAVQLRMHRRRTLKRQVPVSE